MVASRQGKFVYVANANSDTVSVIDTASDEVIETISCRPEARLPFGSGANALALSPDGGTLYAPRPDYGLVMHWKSPSDNAYELGLQGTAAVDGTKTACLFSFDQRIAHSDGNGGYTLGNAATDPCFCLSAKQAELDRLWVRIDAPHRADPPQANRYSDQTYSFELELKPSALLPTCTGKCAAIVQASSCP